MRLPLVWRGHYVAAALEAVPPAVTSRLEDKGFDVIAFGSSEAAWPERFGRLATALGRDT